ncbi:hypothetical protein [Streptomyces europaeiscabiei]|uniref:hypothetical protein n=1 Tax=Streptomyces europaeiscabiei TaxID=146819 RepID=UPI0029A41F49|nr:hypothetical protein [Streptomyces europaeiscabiei]MDX3696062.1 hypothetical protein [Streptomyces europaeiscabiei]WSG28280.1 hypothetical protein OHB30_49460 [Streptomyces europaeiscabiei]
MRFIQKQKHLLAATGLAGALALGVASSAYALGSGSLNLNNGTGKFTGSWSFYPQGTAHGGMLVKGSVCDTSGDGDGVYSEGRVHGYSWSGKVGDSNGAAAGCGSVNKEWYDPATTYTSYGYYQVCTDDVGSDTCKGSGRLNR